MEAHGASPKLCVVADGNALNALLGSGVPASGSPAVLVDDAAEDVAPVDLAGVWLVVARQRGCKLASAVRASLVVVADARQDPCLSSSGSARI